MSDHRDALTELFASLIAQKASAEVVIAALVSEAALLFPELERHHLETIVMGVLEEARERSGGRRARTNVIRFISSQHHTELFRSKMNSMNDRTRLKATRLAQRP